MKPKTPRRQGMKKDIGHPIFLTYRIIESGKQIKAMHFPFKRGKVASLK